MGIFTKKKDSLVDAVARCDTSAVRNLLDSGANANDRDPDGVPVLMIAGLNADVETMELLVKRGANTNAVQEKWTIMMHLALNNKLQPLQYLLRSGANPNETDPVGTTALMVAALEGHDEIAEALIRAGADLHARDHRGNTAMRNAEMLGKPSMKRLIQQAGGQR